MRKFISNIFQFLLFATVFYVIAVFFTGNFIPSTLTSNLNYRIGSNGHLYTRLSEVNDFQDVDILFLGSSHTYRGFDTRIFKENGYNTFNLGSSSQTPIQTKLLLSRYLESLNPKKIVYEVYPITLSMDGVESSLDIIANDENDLKSIKMAFQINNMKTYNTLIYGLSRDLLGLNDSFTEPLINESDKYISGGYVEREISFNETTTFDPKVLSFNEEQFESFSEIIQSIRKKEIELILVYSPIPKSNYESFSNTNEFDSLMNGYSTYYNFNEIIELNDSLHFYDSHHLNQLGVEIFNNRLIELLNE